MCIEWMWPVRTLPNRCFKQLERCNGGTKKEERDEDGSRKRKEFRTILPFDI